MTNWYDLHASDVVATYEALRPEDVHQSWSHLLDDLRPGIACDIGAGSGRDARWLASRGWDVVAVEQSEAMLALAKDTGGELAMDPAVSWLQDELPSLKRLRTVGYQFDLILLSAVWQHVPEADRSRAFRILTQLLKPGGKLVITLRHGSNVSENNERGFLPVSGEVLQQFARDRALVEILRKTTADLRRQDLEWETLVFQLPDDGSGGLSTLRHIIVNDDKASSYKLGLLRVLTRIAEAFPGAVMRRDDKVVAIPFGLVGLLWLKLYKPLLLQHGLKVGSSAGVGFATDSFNALADWSDSDLHLGASFSEARGVVLTKALRDVCNTVANMPANYITWPGENRQIFVVNRRTVRIAKNARITLNADYLQSFGEVEIPAELWQSMGTFGCWLDPAIVNEWQRLTEGWMGVKPDQGVFIWENPLRTTGEVRAIHARLLNQRVMVPCTWSGKRITKMAVDHAFPWSRWPNNDLWNLLPTRSDVNLNKSDKLVSSSTLHDARQRLLFWWSRAFFIPNGDGECTAEINDSAPTDTARRFMTEASLSLPNVEAGRSNLNDVYEGMLHQRARLKADQQLAEWICR
ncbi:MAG: methyltransferase domain-containing protein [Halieaceae bacterium]|jgi:SAM-dependent methyltransferase|nr:methyltransferase domain-containing protein [Halieaceae bacterium]